MATLPALERLSDQEKDVLIVVLWVEVQCLQTRIAELEAKLREPAKDVRNSSVPPSQTRKANTPTRPPQGTRREASVGRAGGGRPLHLDPDQVIIAKAKVCPHCGEGVSEAGQSLQAVYDKIELPPVKSRSVKMRRVQRPLAQKNFRTCRCRTTRHGPHGRSATVRT
jgi:transposase